MFLPRLAPRCDQIFPQGFCSVEFANSISWSPAALAEGYDDGGRHWPCAAWRKDPSGRNSAAPYRVPRLPATRRHRENLVWAMITGRKRAG
jgi:hypothetical protein